MVIAERSVERSGITLKALTRLPLLTVLLAHSTGLAQMRFFKEGAASEARALVEEVDVETALRAATGAPKAATVIEAMAAGNDSYVEELRETNKALEQVSNVKDGEAAAQMPEFEACLCPNLFTLSHPPLFFAPALLSTQFDGSLIHHFPLRKYHSR